MCRVEGAPSVVGRPTAPKGAEAPANTSENGSARCKSARARRHFILWTPGPYPIWRVDPKKARINA
jgi:hypothetical protein